jgi:hypothetical protein
VQKGEATDTFVEAVSNIIKKEVVYYNNILAGSGSPVANTKLEVGARTPDFRQGRVLRDAHRSQSTTWVHQI